MSADRRRRRRRRPAAPAPPGEHVVLRAARATSVRRGRASCGAAGAGPRAAGRFPAGPPGASRSGRTRACASQPRTREATLLGESKASVSQSPAAEERAGARAVTGCPGAPGPERSRDAAVTCRPGRPAGAGDLQQRPVRPLRARPARPAAGPECSPASVSKDPREVREEDAQKRGMRDGGLLRPVPGCRDRGRLRGPGRRESSRGGARRPDPPGSRRRGPRPGCRASSFQVQEEVTAEAHAVVPPLSCVMDRAFYPCVVEFQQKNARMG
ncbi:translation initiation factor IF-2-like [Vulpes lagopus]|uniref:translation initiation factor IF-2-like n=1 Tax=Vulpes lagopus TaxID=494514 RepID=UPI001BC936F1|nr:translation initiation factor IF-2-like [Vulpes lagopus]